MAFTEPTQDIELLDQRTNAAAYSFNADEDVIAGQAVKVGSDNGVEPSDTDGEQCVGVATQTRSAGDQVQVAGPGTRVRLTAGGSVSAGTQVASHGGTGEEGQVADAATGDYAIAQSFESATAGNTFVGMVVVGGQVN